MLKRILIAIPALILLFAVIYLHGLYAKLVVITAGLLCVHEMMRAESGIAKPLRPIGYAYAVLLFPAYQFAGGFTGVIGLLALCIMAIFVVLVILGRDARDGLVTALPMIYPGLFFAFLLAIVCIPKVSISQFLMIIAFGSAVMTDTFAYFGGKSFGKHKLVPAISPKKTVEGAVAGTIFGTGTVFALGVLFQNSFGVWINPLWYVLLGLVLSVLTQIGDLAASLIKRRLCIKDYGHIMGEHGGALDRLDSVIFICPVVFAFYYIIAA